MPGRRLRRSSTSVSATIRPARAIRSISRADLSWILAARCDDFLEILEDTVHILFAIDDADQAPPLVVLDHRPGLGAIDIEALVQGGELIIRSHVERVAAAITTVGHAGR